MQIDTHNRDYDGPGFKAGPLPKANNAPPGAHYSGLLECPCTDRIKKEWRKQYVTLTQGECNAKIGTAKECFEAGDALFGNERTRRMKVTNQTVKMDTKYPPACSFYNNIVTFNEAKERIFTVISEHFLVAVYHSKFHQNSTENRPKLGQNSAEILQKFG